MGLRFAAEGDRRANRFVSWSAGRRLEQQQFQCVVSEPQHERPVEREQQQRFSSRKPLQADPGPIWRGLVESIHRSLRQQRRVSGTTPNLLRGRAAPLLGEACWAKRDAAAGGPTGHG